MIDNELILKPGRDRSLLRKHPWIFSGAVSKVIGDPEPGSTILIRSAEGKALASAAYSPKSNIQARIWSWDISEEINAQYLNNKLRIAIDSRRIMLNILNDSTNAYRIIFSESDELPGIIADRYDNWLVVQLLTSGAEFWKDEICASLMELTGINNIYERSDVDVRRLEDLNERKGLISGIEPPDLIEISENGNKFLVDIKNGQKTGFYLDQRDNRKKIILYAKNRSILNCFSYTGGFTVYALNAKAKEVTSIDSSSEALQIAKSNLVVNGLDLQKAQWIENDVFTQLRRFRDEGRQFDLIILDPPKFAPTISQVPKAARGYKDINLLAFKLLKPEGILFTFSCSGGISMELFQKIVADAALDAGAHVKVIEKLHQAADHPIALNFPESEYLKGLICQK